jgi:hypothetical protein
MFWDYQATVDPCEISAGFRATEFRCCIKPSEILRVMVTTNWRWLYASPRHQYLCCAPLWNSFDFNVYRNRYYYWRCCIETAR